MTTKTFELSAYDWDYDTLEKNIANIRRYLAFESRFDTPVCNYSYGWRPFESGFEGDVPGIEDEKYLSSWNITFNTCFDGDNLKEMIKKLLTKACGYFQSQVQLKVFNRDNKKPVEVYEATPENGDVTFWKVTEQRVPME